MLINSKMYKNCLTVPCLIFQARSEEKHGERPRVAHVMVNVTILDINDNCPMFVNLPYYAVVSVDALKGDTVTKVSRNSVFCKYNI